MEFVESVLSSPLGACWLAVLEAGPNEYGGWRQAAGQSSASEVQRAVARVDELSFGALMEAAVYAVTVDSGPWTSDAPARVATALAVAPQRAPIAEAVGARWWDQLHAPLDRGRQQWFTDRHPGLTSLVPLFARLGERIYGAGEFTWGGLWTATDPPPEATTAMVGAWEIETGPIRRWWLPVGPEARVFEIHRPSDWARLVSDHPRAATRHPGWELPGINQHPAEVAVLDTAIGRNAARTEVAAHLVPDWDSVAAEYDAVHLSWAGAITTEGRLVDLADGAVTMLRYWFSERTLWLADVFGAPQPAPDPHIDLSGHHVPPHPPRSPGDDLLHRLLNRPARAEQAGRERQ